MSHPVKLLSVTTAVPPNRVSQREAAQVAHDSFSSRYEDFERLVKVFESSGILQRHLVRPLEWYQSPLGWSERNKAYLDGACALFADAATRALADAGLVAADVDTVVTVSSTGLATPGIDARVAESLGFRSDIERVPVFGLGCAGGVTGMGIGAHLARSRPGSCVLVVAVELCSVAFRLDKLTKENIVASALFGDGAAACVLQARTGGLASVEFSGQHTWPGTLDIMGWSVDDTGLGVIFDRAIPPFAEENIAPAIEGILARNGLTTNDVDRFCCHPGGAKVITALERALSLDQGALDHERTVLADYGNMSAPTALFVLDRLIRAGLPRTDPDDRHGAGVHGQLRVAEGCRMTWAPLLLGLVTLSRLGELWLAERNMSALRTQGAVEVAPGHYPAIVLLHASWLGTLWVYGIDQPVQPMWLAVFLCLQAARVWVLTTLGARWTTRILVVPGEALVARGPYRFVNHPNYLVVIGEIAVLPLCLALPWVAVLFSLLNAAVLTVRIRAENAALHMVRLHAAD